MDHPVGTGVVVGVGGGAVFAGSVAALGGSVTIGTLGSTQYQKIESIIENPNLSGGQIRQSLLGQVQNQKLGNIITNLFKPTDKFPGGTAGAIRFTAETGKLISGKDHIIKGIESVKGLEKILQNSSITNQERVITQTLINQLSGALSKINK